MKTLSDLLEIDKHDLLRLLQIAFIGGFAFGVILAMEIARMCAK